MVKTEIIANLETVTGNRWRLEAGSRRRLGQSMGFAVLAGVSLLALLIVGPARAQEAHRIPDAPPDYLKMVNPVDLDKLDKQTRRRIPRLYKNKCRKCHGVEGDGKGPNAELLQIKPAAFSAPGYLAGRKDGQLFWIIMNGSPDTDMVPRGPGTRENLSEQEIWGLIAFIRREFTR